MTVIVRPAGNFGPFVRVDVLPDRLHAVDRGGVATDYPFGVIGAYRLSEDDSLAPVLSVPGKTAGEIKA